MFIMSQVGSVRSESIKKRFYISGEDEYSCSSEALNGLVMSGVLDAMPSYRSAYKGLKRGYIADLVREGGISPCSLLLGLMYIRRLASTNKEYISTISPRQLFLVAMVVASKYMNDEGEMEALTNSEWATIGSTPKSNLDNLERDFLQAIRWELYIPMKEFYEFVASAEGRVAMNQACIRGWCTYTELTTIWSTSSQFQEYMLKHTAKAALTGASLYLVCISTLLAASKSFNIAPETTLTSIQHDAPPPCATPPGCFPSNQSIHVVTNSTVPLMGWEEVWPGDDKGVVSVPSPILSPDGSFYKMLLTPSLPCAGEKWRLCDILLKSCDLCLVSHDHYQDTEGMTSQNNNYWCKFEDKLPPSPPPATPTSPPSTSHLPSHNCTLHQTSPADDIITKATVNALQAEDLGFHHRGTFHWNPLINSSAGVPGNGIGGWMFIVRYLIPL